MTHYFEDMGHADCSICEEAKSMLPHSAVPRSNVPCPSCASKDAELKRLREELDNAKFVEEQVRHANDGFAEENKRLREAIDEMEKAYPSDIFTEPTPDDFAYIHKVRGLSERLHGSWARHLVEVIRRRAKEG